MQQTLFVIPHDWLGGPMLGGWLAIGMIWLVLSWAKKGIAEALGFLPFYLFVALIIRFVLPVLEIDGINPADPLGSPVKTGLAIRGYGVFLLTAILAGVGITIHRGKAVGVPADLIRKLALWMVVAGIVGARLFYVIQKRDEFAWAASPWQFVTNLVDATKGGLVVFGSLIGGSIAAAIFFRVHRLPILRTADLIAPGMALGLAIGRIGCLMNGCCFGGICDIEGVPRISFPAGSPPYMQQMVTGDLIGVRTQVAKSDTSTRKVITVVPGSLAERNGVRVGDRIAIQPIDEALIRFFKSRQNNDLVKPPDPENDRPANDATNLLVFTDRGDFAIPVSQLPASSQGVYPAQIYSALDAFLLCVLLWFFWYVRKADGQVFALMLLLHGISRFLLEMVRQDEAGAFGSTLTISQWISILLIVIGIVMWGWTGMRDSRLVRVEKA